MRYCERCKVKVRTPQKRCPLCNNFLMGDREGTEQLFPDLTKEHSRLLFWFKVYSFACVLTVVICIAWNALIPSKQWWSLIVMGGIFCAWVLSAVAIKKRRNLLKNAMWQMVLACVGMFLWDRLTGWQKWSIDFGIPLTIIAVLFVMIVTAFIKRLTSPEYMIYLLMCSGCGMIPLILLLCGFVTIELPSVLCSALSFLVLAALLIFQGNAAFSELHKATHL